MALSVNTLSQWMARVSHLWLFLDYDGTLANFAAHPDKLEKDPELVELLRQLATFERMRVTIISGRPLASLQELLPVSRLFLAGVYGLEMQTPAGNIIRRGDYSSIRAPLDIAKSRWEKIIGKLAGYYIEDKGWSLTLHAQSVQTKEPGQVLASVRQSASDCLPKDQFRWFEGPNYLEIVPVQAHKGELVKFSFTNYPFVGADIVYIGDDDKDEEAFEEVHKLGGINIQVSSPRHPDRYPGSDYLLDSPGEVRKWLKSLI